MFDFSEQYTLLSYCYVNKKHQAFKLMLERCEHKLCKCHPLDPNVPNKDGTTMFGKLFYENHLEHYAEYQPGDKLRMLH